jgi:uncharacterized membrane protein YbhN (UPF0104 family)
VDDAAILGVALLGVLGAALATQGSTEGAAEAVSAVDDLLGWLDPLWAVAYAAGGVLSLALIVVSLVARRFPLARDLVLAAGLAVGIGALVTQAADGRWPSFSGAFWTEGVPTYPSLRLAIVTAVLMVAVPDLTRPLRYLGIAVVALSTVGSMVVSAAFPAHVLGGLALGVAIAAGVRLAFGSSAGFPHESRVVAGLAALGVDVTDVWRDTHQRGGVARYRAVDRHGAALSVAVYGRDARDTQLFARAWRTLWYRDAGPAASVTRREQVEHEGLMLFAAARAGVPVPSLVVAGPAVSGDALLVTDQPDAPALAALDPGAVTDALLGDVWAAAACLRAARLGHGRLNAWSVVVTDAGVLVTDLAGARINADAPVLATDVAELLVSSSVLVGEDRAVAAARAALGDDALHEALPYVQRAALTPNLRDDVRTGDVDVSRLRERVVAVTGGEMPEVAEVRRVSLRDVLLMALTALAAYALLGQIGDIGIDTIADELAGARWSWVVLALVLAQLPLVCDATATLAAVGLPLPMGPTTVLQSAVKFINLTVPSAAGKIALTMRFLERQGVARSVALTQGSIDGLAGFAVQALVLVVVVPVVDLDVSLDEAHAGPLVWAGIAVLVAGAIGIVLTAAVPALRRRVWPTVEAALSNVRELATSPERLVRLILANVASQVLYALALGASVRAFGGEASLAELLLINTGVSLLGGLVPVPGGIGVTEAGLTAGLVAVGVDESVALAATLTHRMVSFYLPPVWGWFALRWLGRRGFV